jgi:hypothetical protein
MPIDNVLNDFVKSEGLSGIMVMALKKWCLILVYQVQIYQLQQDEQA